MQASSPLRVLHLLPNVCVHLDLEALVADLPSWYIQVQ